MKSTENIECSFQIYRTGHTAAGSCGLKVREVVLVTVPVDPLDRGRRNRTFPSLNIHSSVLVQGTLPPTVPGRS